MYLKLKISILLLSVSKIFITSSQKLCVIGNAAHDDRLFVNLATYLIKSLWLGGYNNRTLAKGPIYPVWLAINYMIGIPLLLAQQFLYICSGLVLITALRGVVTNNVPLVLLYALYLFNPMSFAGPLTRVVREGIYPSLTVLVIACAVGMLLRYKDNVSRLIVWSGGLGIALSTFWLTREEGMWILPSLFMIIAVTIYFLYRWNGLCPEFFKRSLICLLPFFMVFLFINSISLLNRIVYGTYTVVEFKSDSFLSAYGALSRVKHPHWQRYVPVPKEVRELIYKVSPAFQELRPYLEGDLGKGWAVHAKDLVSSPEDIAGGWFIWAFRDAAARAGHHTYGSAADSYYRRLAKEVNDACDQGLLPCIARRTTLAPPFRSEYIRFMVSSFKDGLSKLINLTDFTADIPPSIGDESSLKLFRHLTHNLSSPSDSSQNSENRVSTPKELTLLQDIDGLKTTILNYIGLLYQYILPILVYIAVPLYLINGIRLFFGKKAILFIINTSLLIAIMSRLLLLSYIDVTSFHCINYHYLSPVYPLMLIFVSLAMIDIRN